MLCALPTVVLRSRRKREVFADIVRETIDEAAGMRPGDPNVPGWTPDEWSAYRERLEAAARAAAGRGAPDPGLGL